MTRAGRSGKNPRFLPISEAGSASEAHIAVVHGEDVPLMTLDLPAALRGAAREQVARRQTSDTLGLNADALDVRPFQQPDGQWTRCLIASRDQIADWSAQAGAFSTAILPDYLTLPVADGVWTLDLQDDRLMARLGPQDGFSGEISFAKAQLIRCLADAAPQAVLWSGPRHDDIEALFTQAGIAIESDAAAVAALGLAVPVFIDPVGIDLTQVAGAAQAQRRARLTRWRAPVLLALLALGLWVAGQSITTTRLNAQTQAIQGATTDLVRRLFVPTGPLLDIRAQVSRRVAEVSQSNGGAAVAVSPATLLQRAAGPLMADGFALQSVVYRSDSGLDLEVEATDFAALDTLVAALRAADLGVALTSASSGEDGGVTGQLRIGAGS